MWISLTALRAYWFIGSQQLIGRAGGASMGIYSLHNSIGKGTEKNATAGIENIAPASDG
jgi:hypothetical protein